MAPPKAHPTALPESSNNQDDINALAQTFAKNANLESTEPLLAPKSVRNIDFESVRPKLVSSVTHDASPVAEKPSTKDDLDAKTGYTPQFASDVLMPYASMTMLYKNRKAPSYFIPSSLMMFHIIHIMNDILVDSHYFRRACPDFHPYVFRLYCGILFWIQILRVTAHIGRIRGESYQFLSRFLDTHAPESLPLPGPLVTLFKTLCASQPEIPEYGYVYPALPTNAGPTRRDSFIRNEASAFLLPNVPGIFALLEDLNAKINGTPAVYPSKYQHSTVAATATTFGHHAFPIEAGRSSLQRWSLNSAGLEYPCEADKKMNETFAERYGSFDFETTGPGDNLTQVDNFLGMANRTDWFSRVKDVASIVSRFFKNSGTLADVSVFGYSANQYTIEYLSPETAIPTPTKVADKAALVPFAFRARTSARKHAHMTLVAACAAQTNIRMPTNHPYLANFGTINNTMHGHFWNIAPQEYSNTNEEAYIALRSTVRGLYNDAAK